MPTAQIALNSTEQQAVIEFVKFICSNLDYFKSTYTAAVDQYDEYLSSFTEGNFLQAIAGLQQGQPLPIAFKDNLHNLYLFAQKMATIIPPSMLDHSSSKIIKDLYQISQTYLQEFSAVIDEIEEQAQANPILTEQTRSYLDQWISNNDPDLIELLTKAIDPQQSRANPKLLPIEINLIKEKMGTKLFDELISRYQLKPENFTLDDLRMLIIGILPNCNETWYDNEFILHLLSACKIQHSVLENSSEVIQQLRSTIKMDSTFIDRVSKKTLFDSVINKGLAFLKNTFLSEYSFLIPIRFKANTNFKRDLNTTKILSSITSWQQQARPEFTPFAADEFIFNKLSNADLKDDAIVPTLNSEGEMIFCKVKNFVDQKSIHGFALIPIDPTQSQDLKIVFKNSRNLGEAIFDIEHYLPYQAFKSHRHLVLQELNNIIAEFKQNPELTEEQRGSISLNIGGHGTGGTLAQLLVNELATEKASLVAKQYPAAELEQMLQSNLEEQYNSEFPVGSISESKQAAHQEKFTKTIGKYIKKHIIEPPKVQDLNAKIAPTPELANIKTIKLSTVNAGGIPLKIRNNFIQAMKIIKQHEKTNPVPAFNISCNKIISEQDIVQKTGNTDLAAFVPNHIMPTKLIKFDPPESEKSYRKLLTEIAIEAALLSANFIFTKSIQIIPPLAAVSGFLPLPSFEQVKQTFEKNVTEFVDTVINSHHRTYFDMTKDHKHAASYHIFDNHTPHKHQALNLELTKKIPSAMTNKFFRTIKKSLYLSLRAVQASLSKLNLGFTSPTAELIAQPTNYVVEDQKSRGNTPTITRLAQAMKVQATKSSPKETLAEKKSSQKPEDRKI